QGAARAPAGRPAGAGRGAHRAAPSRGPRAPAAVRQVRGGRVRPALVLAIDGGNSKTDLALVRENGEALALVRGPMGSPQHLGIDGCFSVLDDLLGRAWDEAGLPARKNGRVPAAEVAQLSLAGVDFPAEEREVSDAANERRLASRVLVGNDTLALLRAGTERG